MAFPTVDQASVYLCTGHPLEEDIKSIVAWMLNEPFAKAFECRSSRLPCTHTCHHNYCPTP